MLPLTTVYFKFLTSLRSIIDIVILIPFYLTLATNQNFSVNFLRIFRVFRVFRLLGFLKRFKNLSDVSVVLYQTFLDSGLAIAALLLCVFVFMIFFGSIMYLIEGGRFEVTASYPRGAFMIPLLNGGSQPTTFTDIPAAMYFVSTTLTTVGYGDITAQTMLGRYMAVIIMYCGLVFIALPIAVLSTNFSTYVEEFKERRLLQKRENRFINDPTVDPTVRSLRRKLLLRTNQLSEDADVTGLITFKQDVLGSDLLKELQKAIERNPRIRRSTVNNDPEAAEGGAVVASEEAVRASLAMSSPVAKVQVDAARVSIARGLEAWPSYRPARVHTVLRKQISTYESDELFLSSVLHCRIALHQRVKGLVEPDTAPKDYNLRDEHFDQLNPIIQSEIPLETRAAESSEALPRWRVRSYARAVYDVDWQLLIYFSLSNCRYMLPKFMKYLIQSWMEGRFSI